MKKPIAWKNRIVGYGEAEADQLLANEKNWRVHPLAQQNALAGVLDEVGLVQNIIVNKRLGEAWPPGQRGVETVLDGHLRTSLGITAGQKLPVTYVDLAPEEEALILATLDPLGAMAVADRDQLAALLAEVSTGDDAVQKMLAELAGKQSLYQPNYSPSLESRSYKAADIESAQGQLDGQYTKQRELDEIMCPHCGEKFFLDKQVA